MMRSPWKPCQRPRNGVKRPIFEGLELGKKVGRIAGWFHPLPRPTRWTHHGAFQAGGFGNSTLFFGGFYLHLAVWLSLSFPDIHILVNNIHIYIYMLIHIYIHIHMYIYRLGIYNSFHVPGLPLSYSPPTYT